MRYYSVPRVKADLMRLRDECGARTIVFQDDHFMGDRNRALDIVNIIGDLKLTAVFQNSLTLFALKRPMLEAMKRAGVNQLLLSVESGSARVLREIMHKPLTLPIVEQVANDCRDLGIYTDCNILIGNIRETEADIAEGRAFLRKSCPANWFKIFIATPLVGSEFYEEARAKGFITGDFVNFDYKKANISTDELSQERVEHLQYELNLELNFVCNHDFRIGEEKVAAGDYEGSVRNYRTALLGFLNAVKAKPNHAFGHHFAAMCYDRLGDNEKAVYHRAHAVQASQDPFWQKWLSAFPQVEIGRCLESVGVPAA
jgi:anaerobic magnesium-protoporphyrin IX monomethyl ester cyclase